MAEVDVSKYKRLTDIEHVRKRSSVYVGSISNGTAEFFVPEDGAIKFKEITINYGLQKLFDEIISNSVDEHIRSGNVNNIWVELHQMTGEIVVRDDGGIPVVHHPEHGIYIPEMIFSELRAGSNFDDSNRSTAGTNGMGGALCNILSKEFRVDTCDGKNRFVQQFSDGMNSRTEPSITKSKANGTTITFTPDYDYFGCSLDDDNVLKITRRVYDVAGCNPNIKVHLNGKLIKINSFKQYVEMFTDSSVYDSSDDFEVAVAPTFDDSFRQVSFVNGIDTYNGGNHVEYVESQITKKIREFIKKKHKVDVKPNVIKQQMFLIMKCRINAPTFTSQTKEFMSSEIRNFGTSYTPSDKFIKKVLESEVVQKVLDWVEGEKRRNELAELRKLNKTTQSSNFLKRILKFDDATSKIRSECTLLLSEGDSAAKTILSARDSKLHGVFPLKGKPLNVRDIDVKKLVANEEFHNIMAIIGLKIGEKVKSKSDLRFGRIAIASDSDIDGLHISGLFFNMMHEFWPELFSMGLVYKLYTPLIIATQKGKVFEFFDSTSYNKWANENPGHKYKYYKGLGGFDTKDFKRFLQNQEKYMVRVDILDKSDTDALDIAFDKKLADARKEWLLT